MRDFLTRLTARHAESSASPIVPRSASRFETPMLPIERDVIEPVVREVKGATPRSEINPPEPGVPGQRRVEQFLKSVERLVKTESRVSELHHEPIREPRVMAPPVVPRIIAPTEQPRVVLARKAGAGESQAASEPSVIRVHIGRIDVRATAPSAERPRSRRKTNDDSKPMSLDRYLSGKDRA